MAEMDTLVMTFRVVTELEMSPFLFAVVCAALLLLYWAIKSSRREAAKATARERICKKRDQVAGRRLQLENRLVGPDGILLTDERRRIVQLDVEELVSQLQTGQLKCLQVLRAYQAKALEVTRELNCVTEFIAEAEQWAEQLDQMGEQEAKGPLHGLPFSVKDNIAVSGYDSTIGLSKYLHQPVQSDAALVTALKALGAIPFCKTNVSQVMSSPGANNPVWGKTKNPRGVGRTPGGSSGGEGSLIGGGGSLFGLGSDNAGSARLPAAFCGIASLKPTVQRLSTKGFRKASNATVGVHSVPGIMGRDANVVALVSAALMKTMKQFDPDVIPIPWNEQLFTTLRKLRIGYYDDDGFFPTTPGIRRAVRQAASILQDLGHDLVPFQPPRIDTVPSSLLGLGYADGGKGLLDLLKGELVDPSLDGSHIIGLKIPYWIKNFMRPLIRRVDPRLEAIFMAIGRNRLIYSHQLWSEVLKQSEYRDEFASLWRRMKLDLCLSPSFGLPAPHEDDIGRLMVGGSHLCLYNYINFPSGIVPITTEQHSDQIQLLNYPTDSTLCKLVKQTTTGAIGLPLCVQVIGLPWQEELVLRGMQMLQSAVKMDP